jgi:DedD protein
VSELTHDATSVTDDGFHEIQLSGKQLVFLFMTATVVLVATFLLGVQVGRGVRGSQSIDASSAEVLSTATPPPAASTPSQPAASSGPPAAEPPAPAAEADDELSYAKRLQGDNAPAEKLKAPPSPAAHASADKTPAAAPAGQPSMPKAAAPAAAPRANAAPASAGQPGAWVVQLVALKDRGEASAMAKRLAAKGYPAFVLDPSPSADAPPFYRVQVGGFPDRDHADQTARRIEKEEKMQVYVRSR